MLNLLIKIILGLLFIFLFSLSTFSIGGGLGIIISIITLILGLRFLYIGFKRAKKTGLIKTRIFWILFVLLIIITLSFMPIWCKEMIQPIAKTGPICFEHENFWSHFIFK